MRIRELEQWLSQVDAFDQPKMEREQYPTSARMAAHMLHTIHTKFDDIEGKAVADLGCGCGVLAIGTVLLGAEWVVGIDIDPDALDIATRNCEEMEVPVEFLMCDLIGHVGELDEPATKLPFPQGGQQIFDTVIMNPPFGTKKETTGFDVRFLERALSMSRGAVYSLHKSSTRRFLLKTAAAMGVDAEVVAEMRWELPATYRVHKKKSVDIAVDFIRFAHRRDEQGVDTTAGEKTPLA